VKSWLQLRVGSLHLTNLYSSRCFMHPQIAHRPFPDGSQFKRNRINYEIQAGRNMTKPGKIRVCPRCGNTELKKAKSSVSGWLVPDTYFCSDEECGYSGPVFVEVEVEEAEHLRRVINGDSH
ncbi:MAG: hypothetical protein ACFE7R_11810, partial [Candidatus Hodarchaeota archaeon]